MCGFTPGLFLSPLFFGCPAIFIAFDKIQQGTTLSVITWKPNDPCFDREFHGPCFGGSDGSVWNPSPGWPDSQGGFMKLCMVMMGMKLPLIPYESKGQPVTSGCTVFFF